uniref:hypothetical protein n=1 Tax=Gemmiger formicilis TaxID=745368 RepID=UPI004027A6E9
APLRRLRHGICVAKMLDNTQSIICAFGLAAAAPRSPYRHLELCGIAQRVMRMKEEKVKVNLRVGLLIRETLVDEAAVEDIRVGTLANRLLQSEMDKVMKVGADNCLIMNSREYLASEAEIEQNRAAYYLFPETKVVSRFIATQLDDKIYPQISFYFLKEQMDALEKLVRKQRIPQTIRNGAVHSYRYVIAGMLLNHPLCRALGASANND